MTETSTYFKAANPSDWSAMVEKVLKGASADSLARRDEDGLVTHAFYPATDDDATAAALLPTSPASRLTGGWEICQPLPHGSSNDDILGALASGATALSLADTDPQTIAARLQSVVLSAITIGFEVASGPVMIRPASMKAAMAIFMPPCCAALTLVGMRRGICALIWALMPLPAGGVLRASPPALAWCVRLRRHTA
jgi:hypothetical protein